jgi:polysaccharide export outer membrane protein
MPLGIRQVLFALVFFLVPICLGTSARGADPNAGSLPVGIEADAQHYRLGSGDKVKVTVFNEPDLSGEFPVSDQGAVAMPLVGAVSADGKTLAEFATALEIALRAGYVKEPRVSVEVSVYRPFFILGEVKNPGTYPYSANLTVVNAAATAGGFTYRADTKKVFIKSASQEAEQSTKLTGTTLVRPGDTIRIPERRF